MESEIVIYERPNKELAYRYGMAPQEAPSQDCTILYTQVYDCTKKTEKQIAETLFSDYKHRNIEDPSLTPLIYYTTRGTCKMFASEHEISSARTQAREIIQHHVEKIGCRPPEIDECEGCLVRWILLHPAHEDDYSGECGEAHGQSCPFI